MAGDEIEATLHDHCTSEPHIFYGNAVADLSPGTSAPDPMSEGVVRPVDSRIAENRLTCQATACVLQIEDGTNDRLWPTAVCR